MTVPDPYKPVNVSLKGIGLPRREPAAGKRNSRFRERRFLMFFSIGIVSTLVDTGLLLVFTEYCGIWYLWSAAASYCCGILVSYFLNKHYTFHDTNRHYLSQFAMFAAISGSGLALNLVVMLLAVDLLGFHYLLGKALAIGVSFAWNYTGQSRITFHG
jgi:putative flippase GtrA